MGQTWQGSSRVMKETCCLMIGSCITSNLEMGVWPILQCQRSKIAVLGRWETTQTESVLCKKKENN